MKLNNKNYGLIETMRWFGPNDKVSLQDIAQAGCSGVVSALHHIPNGQVWPVDEIRMRKETIEVAGLSWDIVESVPVHEAIKKQSAGFELYIENYKQSIRNLAACGINIITYNFMPILDWTRTNLAYNLPNGSKALLFERAAYLAFDIHILKREKLEYSDEERAIALRKFNSITDEEKNILTKNIIAGLPGSEESFSIEDFKAALETYNGINHQQLQKNLFYFLQHIIPVAEEVGVTMVVHPDDPPYSMFGLPRVVSTQEDVAAVLNAVHSKANGLCFCTGSFGASVQNNLPTMLTAFIDKVYFFHLRSVNVNEVGDFYEDNHLQGNANLFEILKIAVPYMHYHKRRIVVRPDHGHQMLDDLRKITNPGYTAIGRLKGLAEIRGLELGITKMMELEV